MHVIISDVHYFNCALLMCTAGNIYMDRTREHEHSLQNHHSPSNKKTASHQILTFDLGWLKNRIRFPAKILPRKGICGSELIFPNIRSCFFWNDFSFPMFLIIISCIFIQQREAFIIFACDDFCTFYVAGINKYVYYSLGFGWARGLNFLYKEVTDL